MIRALGRDVNPSASDALGIGDKTGSIAIGKAADIAIVNDATGNDISDFATLVEDDILAVFVDGNLMTGDSHSVGGSWIPSHCPNMLGSKFVCVDFSQYPFSFGDMKIRNASKVALDPDVTTAGISLTSRAPSACARAVPLTWALPR